MTTRGFRWILGFIAVAVHVTAASAFAAPFAYVTSSYTNSVAVLDAATNQVVGNVSVGQSPFGVAVHPSGAHVYVTNWGDGELNGTVSVISTATNTVAATIPVGVGPFGVAVNPAGTRVYVANQLSNTVSVIDTATLGLVGTIDVGVRPIGVAVHPSGTRIYVANQWSWTLSVVDLVANTVEEVAVGSNPRGVAVAPDGSRVYVTNAGSHDVSVIDAGTNQELLKVPVGPSPFGIAVHPNGSRVYVANRGSWWISIWGSISIIDTASHSLLVTVPTDTLGLFGIGVHPAGTHVYAASEDSDVMVILETATNTVTGSIPVPGLPAAFGMFFTSAGATSVDTATCDRSDFEAAVQTQVSARSGQGPTSSSPVAAAARAREQCNVEVLPQAAPTSSRRR